ncbi:MAG: thiol:disulfide interchange protein DsbA/DsbL [Marinobacter sp.]|uniref:thiol:disulfide interchange protein DsbA/DsbL n=1 Tax=Marinobacter sp. TaxID=50741 RepID=UPI00299E07CD|nr:thiol:disulfide interchange protein DsbA/DsbL [Marinobacter sp.]MDX1634527.1 thiol:disulfide interchange protein DsbA/DsbL [Marinobacter sp.]
MTVILRAAVLLLALASFGAQAQSTEFREGEHYRALSNPVPTGSGDKIEVAEVFWYGCPHCYSFKPLIEKWEQDLPEDVQFELLPAALGQSWEPHARAFYTVKALDKFEQTHDALFDALARDRKPLNDAESLADFLSEYGVDPEKFVKTFNSFGVNAKMQQAQAKIRGARITGVPAMLVNGKYVVSASLAGSHEQMLEVVDYLIEKERAQ